MGHACTKDINAERVERRRIERERRLGVIRQQPPPTPQSGPPLVTNGIWPQRVVREGVRTVGNMRASGPPSQTWRPPIAPVVQIAPQPLRQATPERRASIGNPNSPFNEFRPAPAPLRFESRALIPDEIELRPIVVQALNQLCAMELQMRVHLANEEVFAAAHLMHEFERIYEMEALRVARRELIALESRSRASIEKQQASEQIKLCSWISELLEEIRLEHILKKTQDRMNLSGPHSQRSSPVRSRPTHDQSDWLRNVRPTAFHDVNANDLLSRGLNKFPPRDEYSRVVEVADRMISDEEASLNAKIARQRGLMDSTRSMYRIQGDERRNSLAFGPARPAPRAPQLLQDESVPIVANSPGFSHEQRESSASMREASFRATQNRMSALALYQ